MKLFYEPTEEQYYVFYETSGKILLFKVDQFNPLIISRVFEHGLFIFSHERGKVIEETKEFVKKEIEKVSDNF